MVALKGFRERLANNPRLSSVLHGSASAVVGKGLTMIVSLVTLPLMVRYLGQNEYGIWATISTSVVMFSVLDIGISSTLVNFVAKAHADNDHLTARGYYSTAFWITASISAAVGTLIAIFWRSVNWGVLLGVHDQATVHQASGCVMAALGYFLLNLPLSLANKILGGYQKVQVANYFSMCGSVLGMIAIVGGVFAHLSLAAMMICYCSAMLLGTLLLNCWVFFRSHPWMKPSAGSIRKKYVGGLFGDGVLFFVLQMAGIVVFNSDNLVITHYCGPGEVTPYSVAWRLMGYASMLQGLLVPSLWPALADAYHRREIGWVRAAYFKFQKLTMGAVLILALILALFGQGIIRVWASQSAVPSQLLLWLMAAWAVAYSTSVGQACLLAATQRLRIQAVTAVGAAVLNLFLSIALVPRIGSAGAIIGTVSSYLLLILVPQEWEVRNILNGRYLEATNALVS